jgi:hypothetical protein
MGSYAIGRARRVTCLVIATAALVGLHACSLHPSASSGPADDSVITEAEIDSVHAVSGYDAVEKLRPRFLMSRGKLTLNPSVPPALPNVYVDLMFYGDISTLRSISAASIESIKFYSSSEAQYVFGHGNMAGVIGVTTKH